VTLKVPRVDADFLRTMRIPLVAGRTLKDGLAAPGAPEGLLNEAAVRALGWASPEEALGKRVRHVTVVGVVGAFHFETLHHPIEPLLLVQHEEANANLLGVRLRGGAVPATLAALERTWKRLDPAAPFEFSFLRDEMDRRYEKEQRAAQVFGTFAGLAVLIACLGLFGLASFTAERRTKEVGIRKVLGATVAGLVVLLSREFVKLVALAFVVAAPVAYVAMDRWLQAFAYRIRVGPSLFLAAGAAALAVALASVGFQAVRAARANPADSLRYE
jgi:putative ABC transport system permease protein